jgi:hypothetical protein
MQWSPAATLQLETKRSFTVVAEAREYRESVAMSKEDHSETWRHDVAVPPRFPGVIISSPLRRPSLLAR